MRWALALPLLAAGCQQLFGLDPPLREQTSPSDAAGDSLTDSSFDASTLCTMDAAAVNSTVMYQANGGKTRLTITQVRVANSTMPVVSAGSTVDFSLHYDLKDDACANCIDQIEYGLIPGTRIGCVYDAVPGTTASGDATGTFVAPTEPGRYDMRVNLGQDFSCTSHTGWWASTPTDALTIARLCVR